ncbi:MAG: hypothetical protein ACREDY_11365, partial [Bradyrhizobium sp.]
MNLWFRGRRVKTPSGRFALPHFVAAPAAAVVLALAACTVGPDYERPAAPTPAQYKEAAGWKLGRPADAIDRGAWWSIYK